MDCRRSQLQLLTVLRENTHLALAVGSTPDAQETRLENKQAACWVLSVPCSMSMPPIVLVMMHQLAEKHPWHTAATRLSTSQRPQQHRRVQLTSAAKAHGHLGLCGSCGLDHGIKLKTGLSFRLEHTRQGPGHGASRGRRLATPTPAQPTPLGRIAESGLGRLCFGGTAPSYQSSF
jgi:hypothetical protein